MMFKSWMIGLASVACGVGVCAATEVNSALYVQDGLVLQLDGLDNTLVNGVRGHADAPSVWSDLSGHGNDVPFLGTGYQTIETNAVLSLAGANKVAGVDYPTISALNGLDALSNGEPITVECVMQCLDWVPSANYNQCQHIVVTPRGCFGYHGNTVNDGFFFLPLENATQIRLAYGWVAGAKTDAFHTFAALFGPGAWSGNGASLDGSAFTMNSLTLQSWKEPAPSGFQFFENLSATIRVFAIRVYNRRLTDEELQRNAMLDRVRFLGESLSLIVREGNLPAQTFRQQAIWPELTVLDPWNGTPLTRDVDYRLDYADNDKPGLATVTAVGLGVYAGSSVARTFRIVQPECYCPITYIESSGTQWIDTGYFPNGATRMEADIQFVGDPANRLGANPGASPFGCSENNGWSYFGINFGESNSPEDHAQDNTIYTWFHNSYDRGAGVRRFTITTEQRLARTLFQTDATSEKAYFGEQEITVSAKNSSHTQVPLALFGFNTDGVTKPFTYYGLRVYGWKIWEGETLLHNFQPVMRLDDSAVGLLDRETGLFHENAGTGTFVYGLPMASDELPPEYQAVSSVISDGGAWVDTGVKATSNTTTTVLCVPYFPTDEKGAGQRIISARATSGSDVAADELLYEIYANSALMWSCACADGPGDAQATTDGLWSASDMRYWDNRRWSVTLDSWGNAFYVNGTKCVTLARPRAATSPANITLFSGGGSDPNASGVLERAFVWERGRLVRNFVPCCRAADGVAGLYDLVGQAFYPSAGSVPFRHTTGIDRGVNSLTALATRVNLGTGNIYTNLLSFSFTAWVRNIATGARGWLNNVTHEQEYYGSVLGQGALGQGAGFNCFVIDYTVQQKKELMLQLRNVGGQTKSISFNLGSIYQDGKWHHLAFTCDRDVGAARLYLDGREMANCTDAAELLDVNGAIHPFCIGGCDGEYPAKGEVVQVTLWNRAITPGEIQRLRSHPATGLEEGLLGWWPLDCGDAGLKDGVNNGATPHDLAWKLYMGFLPGEVKWFQHGSVLLVR